MGTQKGFLLGLGVGLVCGVVGAVVVRTETPSSRVVPLTQAEAEARERAAVTLETRGALPVRSKPAVETTSDARPTEPATKAPQADVPEDAAYRTKLDEVRAALKTARSAKPGSAVVLELLASFRALLGHANPQIARLGGRALIYLAGTGKLRDEDVQGLAKQFGKLDAGAAARPALAGAVALAWASDARLADWLTRLPAEEEPKIRATVVEALDESASAAYREYLLRLSRTEKDADVLEHAWHEDPVTVAMTREWAPRLVAAVGRRVEEGGLPPVVRGRGVFAIGLAAVHESAAAAAAIGRLIDDDADDGVRAYGRAVLAAIAKEEANVQTLDRLWAEHRATFGKP